MEKGIVGTEESIECNLNIEIKSIESNPNVEKPLYSKVKTDIAHIRR